MKNYSSNQKGIAPIVIILIVVGALILVGGGIWYWQSQKEKPAQESVLISVKVLDEETQSPINGAEVTISYYPPPCVGPDVVGFSCPPGPEFIEIKKSTDTNGEATFYNEDKNFKKRLLENIKNFPEVVGLYSGASKMINDKITISAQKKDYLYNYQEIIIKDLIEGKYLNQIITLSLINTSKIKENPNYCNKFSEKEREKCFESVDIYKEIEKAKNK